MFGWPNAGNMEFAHLLLPLGCPSIGNMELPTSLRFLNVPAEVVSNCSSVSFLGFLSIGNAEFANLQFVGCRRLSASPLCSATPPNGGDFNETLCFDEFLRHLNVRSHLQSEESSTKGVF